MFLYLLLLLFFLTAYKLWGIFFYWSVRGIPHQSYLSYLHFVFVRSKKEDLYLILRDLRKQYGPIYGSYQGLTPALRVSDLEIVREVFVKKFHLFTKRSLDTRTSNPLWDNTLFGLEYPEWKKVRQHTGTSFTSAKFRAIIPKVKNMSSRLCQQLCDIAASKNNSLDLQAHLDAYSLDVVGAVAYAVDLDSMKNPDGAFVRNAKGLFDPSTAITVLSTMPKIFPYIPFLHHPNKAVTEFFRSFTYRLIKERRQAQSFDGNGDFLDMWLSAQKKDPEVMTDEVIASNAFVFLTAGFDTTSFSLNNLFYYFALHPEVQEKAYLEIQTVLAGRDDLEFDDIAKLSWTRACIDESIRIIPIAHQLDRVAQENATVAGIEIDAGTVVQVPIAPVHFDPENFPDPEKYKPERFLKNSSEGDNTAAFLGFGDGPKNCVGQRLALFNMSQAVAHIMSKIKIEACDETPRSLEFLPRHYFFPRTTKPLKVHLVLRNQLENVAN